MSDSCIPAENQHKLCAQQECSTGGGICISASANGTLSATGNLQSELSADVLQPPSIRLRIEKYLSETVFIKRGTKYQTCDNTTSQMPTADLPCELGAIVNKTDREQEIFGIRSAIFTCLPSECIEKVSVIVHINI